MRFVLFLLKIFLFSDFTSILFTLQEEIIEIKDSNGDFLTKIYNLNTACHIYINLSDFVMEINSTLLLTNDLIIENLGKNNSISLKNAAAINVENNAFLRIVNIIINIGENFEKSSVFIIKSNSSFILKVKFILFKLSYWFILGNKVCFE